MNTPDRTCSVAGCERPLYGRRLCNPHWQRRRNGNLRADDLIQKQIREPVGHPLDPKNYTINEHHGCFETLRSRTSQGYAKIKTKGKHQLVCRILMDLKLGDPLCALHTCGRGHMGCINPAHLYVGTPSDNQFDSVRDGTHYNGSKTHCKHGHKFTEENTYNPPDGGRRCLTCKRRNQRALYRLNAGAIK